MIELRGMTIKELKDTLDEMHKVYAFKPEKTRFCNIRDIRTDSPNRVEIVTTDEETSVEIIMSKELTADIFKGVE